jgi:hypothetical protein
MSTDSHLIIFQENVPEVADVVEWCTKFGSIISFPIDFDFRKSFDNFVEIEIDGQKVHFSYAIQSIIDYISYCEDNLPEKLRRYGDTILSFETRGTLSTESVSLIQRVMAKNCKAAGYLDGEIIHPRTLAKDTVVSTKDIEPELAATMIGTPAQRASAIDAYIDIQISKTIAANLSMEKELSKVSVYENPIKIWINENRLKLIIFIIALLGLIGWDTLRNA